MGGYGAGFSVAFSFLSLSTSLRAKTNWVALALTASRFTNGLLFLEALWGYIPVGASALWTLRGYVQLPCFPVITASAAMINW